MRDNFPKGEAACFGHFDAEFEADCPDGPYLAALDQTLALMLEESSERSDKHNKYDLVVYVAGADPLDGDPVGGLAISKAGLAARDARMAAWCKTHGFPVAVVLAGGYSAVEDVVDVHHATLEKILGIAAKCSEAEAVGAKLAPAATVQSSSSSS